MFKTKMIPALALTLTALCFNVGAQAADAPRDRIDNLLGQISVGVESQPLTAEQLGIIEQKLQQTLEFINGSASPKLICMKQGNGRFYPASSSTGNVLGDTDYSAGFSGIDDCRATLPRTPGAPTCFKRSNGRYYPTNSLNGKIIGSNDYAAGYSDLADCLSTIQ